jgi:hypothetical protein
MTATPGPGTMVSADPRTAGPASEAMNERGPEQRQGMGHGGDQSVRGSALSLLLGGGVCLYFGLTLIADAPGSATADQVPRWFAADHTLFWCLRGFGVLFVMAAALAALGQRVAMLVATVAEAGFAVLMVAMTVEWTLKARADGTINYEVILLLILAIVGVSAARNAWGRWTAGRSGARRASESDADHP